MNAKELPFSLDVAAWAVGSSTWFTERLVFRLKERLEEVFTTFAAMLLVTLLLFAFGISSSDLFFLLDGQMNHFGPCRTWITFKNRRNMSKKEENMLKINRKQNKNFFSLSLKNAKEKKQQRRLWKAIRPIKAFASKNKTKRKERRKCYTKKEK